jgi:metal-responsive CopG/Arc/MetJ family transcriptional regulator
MKRSTKILTVSIPAEAEETFERLAQEEGRNKSELFREMLRVYSVWRETQEFESLQRYGASQARRLGIRDEQDVERLIQELREA